MNANDEALALGTSLVANEPAVQFAEMAERCARSRLKRTLDIIGSGLGLVALSPLLGLVALVIYLQDRGPVLFRQQRTGLNGQVFDLEVPDHAHRVCRRNIQADRGAR